MMQTLQPCETPEDERYALEQTNAINSLLIKNGSPRFGSVSEVRRVVAHAQKGGILSMGELLEIAATLRNFAGLSQWYGLSEHDMMPTDDLFYSLAPQPVLERQISDGLHLAGRNGRHRQHHAGRPAPQDPPDRGFHPHQTGCHHQKLHHHKGKIFAGRCGFAA